jgi:hypothetical protein
LLRCFWRLSIILDGKANIVSRTEKSGRHIARKAIRHRTWQAAKRDIQIRNRRFEFGSRIEQEDSKKAPEAVKPRVGKNRRLSGRHQALTQILHQPFGEMSPDTDLQDDGGSNSLQLLHFEEPLGLP